MAKPAPRQIFWLRRIRLLRAQRHWRQLLGAYEQLRQALLEIEQQCKAQRDAAARCLRHAEAGTGKYALIMRRASAHQRLAASLANQAELLSTQLGQMISALRCARISLEKARRLLEESSPR